MTGSSMKQTTLFSGLRFLLAGFDETYEDQVIEELVANKGQIAKRYDSSSTHVIVSNLTYTDPICAAARKDGKALVTDIWVADCLDADTLVDVNKVSFKVLRLLLAVGNSFGSGTVFLVLYKPPKDLDGIRGGEKLCVCLTGYQGLERKQIMRMVELTGAKFTKPLVGSLVTHLICYKFEGEKYELAKKTGLALVNHFWLEDCLKAWTLLPVSGYAQSGWEAETLRSREIFVEDSPEHDALAICDETLGKKSSLEKVSSPFPVQVVKQLNLSDTIHHELSKDSKTFANCKTHDRLSSHFSAPAHDSKAEEQVVSTIGHTDDISVIVDGLEHVSTVSKPRIEDVPVSVVVEGSENVNRSSVLNAQEDETTDLYVEEGNESDHSSGRTSYEEVNNESNVRVGEIKVSEPEHTPAAICRKMEITGVAAEHTPKRRISDAEALALKSSRFGPSGDSVFESSGTKRRKRLQLASRGGPPLERMRGCTVEEAKDFRAEECVFLLDSALNQQTLAIQGSSVQQESSTVGHLADKPPQDINYVINDDTKTSADKDKSIISINGTDHGKEQPAIADDAWKAQELPNIGHKGEDGADTASESPNQGGQKSHESPNIGSEGHMHVAGPETERTSPNQGRQNARGSLDIGKEGHMHLAGADIERTSPNQGRQKAHGSPDVQKDRHMHRDGADIQKESPHQGGQKSVQPASSLGSTCTDEKKEVAPKNNDSPSLARPVTLLQLAQTYNPARREKGNQKKKHVTKDKENLTANDEENLAANDKENLTAKETNQKVHPKAVKRKTVTKSTCAVTRAPTLESSHMCFAVGGSSDERTRLHSVIKVMGGKICKSRHQWRNEATHVVLPGPLRRTEKFLAGAAAGRWILKPEYLEASSKAGKFLEEEPYEWYGEGTNDKGSISLQAPRKWRISQAASGVGAFHGLRVLFYGECISPPLDTFKRAIKAGGGLVSATTPPYTRHLADGVNFAIISPGITQEDQYVREFLKHEIACVTSEYFVDLVCHPSSSLEQYILYETTAAVNDAQQHRMDIAKVGNKCAGHLSESLQHNRSAQIAPKAAKENAPFTEDISCSVCGRLDGEDIMLLCGDDKGGGCGIGIHIHCCTPPLHKVPDEDWFCSKCQVQVSRLCHR